MYGRLSLRLMVLSLAVLGGFACDDDEPAATTPETTEPTPPTGTGDPATDQREPSPTGMLMRAHFERAREARQALIAGEIDAAKTEVGWLANNDPTEGELPAPLRPHLEAMREKARAFGGAETLTDAGQAFGRMLTHCGDCHKAVSGGPTFAMPPMPGGEALADRMQKHRWAADRMWEGLVIQDEEMYDAGANALTDVFIRQEELPQGVTEPARLQAIADNVKNLAAEGAAATEWPARADVFGRFIATCATCHRMMGVGAFARQVMDQGAAVE
jgi:cytochrome c553